MQFYRSRSPSSLSSLAWTETFGIAPPRGLSTPRALKVKLKKNDKMLGSPNTCCSYKFTPYSACAKLWRFPNISAHSEAPWASKRSYKLQFAVCTFPIVGLLAWFLKPIWAIVTRPVQGPYASIPDLSLFADTVRAHVDAVQELSDIFVLHEAGLHDERRGTGGEVNVRALDDEFILEQSGKVKSRRRELYTRRVALTALWAVNATWRSSILTKNDKTRNIWKQ